MAGRRLTPSAIGLSGYVGGAAQRSESAEWGIRAAAGIVPAGCVLVAIAIMLAYPLTERRFREITEQVRLRRGEQDTSSSAVAES